MNPAHKMLMQDSNMQNYRFYSIICVKTHENFVNLLKSELI